MSGRLLALASFPPANYLQHGTVAERAHRHACNDNLRTPAAAHEVKVLADAIYAQAVRCGRDGDQDYTRAVIVRNLLASFVALLNYDTGGWDGGTCDAWARSVAEYVGQPMD